MLGDPRDDTVLETGFHFDSRPKANINNIMKCVQVERSVLELGIIYGSRRFEKVELRLYMVSWNNKKIKIRENIRDIEWLSHLLRYVYNLGNILVMDG